MTDRHAEYAALAEQCTKRVAWYRALALTYQLRAKGAALHARRFVTEMLHYEGEAARNRKLADEALEERER